MSKAILVMDMPTCCSECPCCYVPRCEVFQKGITRENIYESKPNWCPLREISKKKEANVMHYDTDYNYALGFNDCIDEILKGSEENG